MMSEHVTKSYPKSEMEMEMENSEHEKCNLMISPMAADINC